MGKLRVNGQVSYLDGTPAEAVNIVIIEKDRGPGGKDDTIFEGVTNATGKFGGLTREWQDREGRKWGIDIPDILNLAFRVKDGENSHAGPFVRLGNTSAPIVLPWLPSKPVAKSKRELVQVVCLSEDLEGPERALYQFIEGSAKTLTGTVLGGSYRRITCIEGRAATLAGFVKALQAATDEGVVAVDVMLNLHGITDALVFADKRYTAAQVGEALMDLPKDTRKKFRCLFSTACYGSSHMDEWIAAGFSDAMGSRGIFADAQTSFAPMLGAWALERTFAEAVNAANAADPLRLADQLARGFYTARGMDATASEIDSVRRKQGRGTTRIYSKA